MPRTTPVAPRRRGAAGQTIVEFALVLPVFLMLTVGLIDLGRAFWAYTSLRNVAAEGARAAVGVDLTQPSQNCLTGGSSGNTGVTVQQAIAEAPDFGLDSSPLTGASTTLSNRSFTLTAYNTSSQSQTLCTPLTSFTFTVTYTFTPLVSIVIGQGSITMNAQATLLAE